MKLIGEPHKIKTIRNVPVTTISDRRQALQSVYYNTYWVSQDKVSYEMSANGTSAMSQEQLSEQFLGDEAYAGAKNFYDLESAVREVFGFEHVVPTHNLLGCLKLLAKTQLKEGDIVLSNSGKTADLVRESRAKNELIVKNDGDCIGDLDIKKLDAFPKDRVKFIFVDVMAEGYKPVSLDNLQKIQEWCVSKKKFMVIDLSNGLAAAGHLRATVPALREKKLMEIVRLMANTADVMVFDLAEDARCKIGGFIGSKPFEIYEPCRNEVVVYEGLHTYGGMTGRAMGQGARGLQELKKEEQAEWILHQVDYFAGLLAKEKVPFVKGANGLYLDVASFLPKHSANGAATLAAAIYHKSGMRCHVAGRFQEPYYLPVLLPRLSFTNLQIQNMAGVLNWLYKGRDQMSPLHLNNQPKWLDQAQYRGAPDFTDSWPWHCEPYIIHSFERVGLPTPEERQKAIKEAGYNTFLLRCDQVMIDFLTDSGTAAQSVTQWAKMTEAVESQASNNGYQEFVTALQEILGYKYIIPTHQGRAAEHILSQVLIKKGTVVPGNMYFTTTKLHQEMAGGEFADVIVDEAHDPVSTFPWKGNVDLKKLEDLIAKHGAKNIPYISYEMCVNMAGGQPFSMDNARDLYKLCSRYDIPVMFDATRAVENANMIQRFDPRYKNIPIKAILFEMMQYGDGATMSSKKDCLVNMGGFLAYRDNVEWYEKSMELLRQYEGTSATGGLCVADMIALTQGIHEMVDDHYIRARIDATHYLGKLLKDAGVPIVEPPGSHAIFLDAKRFLPHLDQDQYPSQALAAAIYEKSGIRTMERGNVSKGRDPKTGKNYRPALELVRLTIPRRVYTHNHMEIVAATVTDLYKNRDKIKGLKFSYEPPYLRFFQGRFERMD